MAPQLLSHFNAYAETSRSSIQFILGRKLVEFFFLPALLPNLYTFKLLLVGCPLLLALVVQKVEYSETVVLSDGSMALHVSNVRIRALLL